jgi:hypothetical protein
MQFNSDFKYDLQIGVMGEEFLAELLQNKKIEVKTDFKAKVTGNIFVELKSRGKWSGISTTESEYICYILEGTGVILIFQTVRLKALIKHLLQDLEEPIIKGGDMNTSQGILLQLKHMDFYTFYMREVYIQN